MLRRKEAGAAVRVLLALAFILLAAGCTGRRAKTSSAARAVYPVAFVSGDFAPHGLGLSYLPPMNREYADSLATDMAIRGLAWATHVRVRGERLFERTGGGDVQYRGQNVELLDVPEISSDACVLDTCVLGGFVWVSASSSGAHVRLCANTTTFSMDMPSWVLETPSKPGWVLAQGTAPYYYKDEPGAWEVGTYRAVVELAMGQDVTVGNVERVTRGAAIGGTRVGVDSHLNGVRVAGRWRDERNVYVLVASPTQ